MRLQLVIADFDAGLHQGDFLPHQHAVIDLAKFHRHQVEKPDPGTGQESLQPKVDKAEENQQHQSKEEDADQGEQEQDVLAGQELVSGQQREFHASLHF